MIIRMRGMLQRRGISSRQFKTKGSFYHRRQLVTIRVRGNRRFPTARRRHFSNSRGGNGGKKNSSSGNNNNNKQRNQHQDQGTKRKSKPFVPTEQRVRNRDLPWIRETFDRHQRRTFLPGFDSYRQLDFVLLITLTTGVTSLCIFGDGGNDPVMQDAFSYLLSSLEDLREGHRFWLLPLMPWVCPDISSPSLTPTTFLLLGWPWFFALGATLSCRMSTGILASVYTAAGVSGCLAEAYSLQALQGRNHDGVSELSYIAKRKLDEESQRPLAGTSPAIQGLKGAAMASWIETASAFSFCYFHTDVLPYRRYDMIGSETDSERARLRGNQVGALTGVFLFLALRSLGRLRPPVRM
eukprot:jgi/Bigna1/80352/fgenesh1_pg.70_\